MSIIDTLITDRTQADVIALQNLLRKAKAEGLTEEERALWNEAIHRGSYNYTDLNRVSEAAVYLHDKLIELGYDVPPISKVIWNAGSKVIEAELNGLLADVANLRAVLPVPASTPVPPTSINFLTIGKANDIETVLATVDKVINTMVRTFPPCGDVPCGGENA